MNYSAVIVQGLTLVGIVFFKLLYKWKLGREYCYGKRGDPTTKTQKEEKHININEEKLVEMNL